MDTEKSATARGRRGRINPFPVDDVRRDDRGILRYSDLPTSLVAMLRAVVDQRPEQEALVELEGERLSYEQLWDRASRVAGGLRSAGVEPGDRVAIHLSNGIDWVLAFWGVQMAAAIAVPVNTRFSAAEVDYVVSDSGARRTLALGSTLPIGAPFVATELGGSDVAAIFYTSGTTGFPKGAMTTHENFLANCESCRRVVGFSESDDVRNLISVPLFHVTGCNSQLLGTLMLGGTAVIMPAFEVQAFLRAVVDEKINVLMSVPAIYWLAMNQPNFADFDLRSVRWLAYGGAPISSKVIEQLRVSFPNARLGNGFGLTETSAVSTYLPDEYCDLRPETVGFAAPVVDVDLFEPDASGVGELLVRGQNVVAGYWNKPDETARTFVDGWLHTGDLARIDEDGFVQIVDRAKDMVNRGGENVYCVEVENALVGHPAVFECAVLGVPDEMMGEKVGAVVVARPGTIVTAAELAAFAGGQLADFKVPQYIAFRDDPLPRNAGGKVLKAALRAETRWGDALR